ncbi:AraC family transcriptional regulator [Actinosynnema sp. ALI-1.44]|uniref:helix-turn-helix transcriptional regulator n=1 Tax=Actinosynnema sp. ALI-1.44 TaxID=1933779 RepID=UPI00097C941B|nr:AraC family transcriptional regulator [Actinosynnema sp. ALI-1.44]ONI83074.1 AraC family transcriptional regulator [Actinosynnema sp. ALI-1.44]
MLSGGHIGSDPVVCEEYGYGLGTHDGILVLVYRCDGRVDFGESREDFLHQLYWTPDGVLATVGGFVTGREGFWARRAVTHEVTAAGAQTVYRVCLREVPPALRDVRAGGVSVSPEAIRLMESLGRDGVPLTQALAARERIMAGLGVSTSAFVGHHAAGSGFAMTIARVLTRDPADRTQLDEWASRLHTSVKTVQRDFEREFGMSYSRWRTVTRLRAAKALLQLHPVGQVAHQVGYDSPSAFVAAFAKEFGCTPGRVRPDPSPS